MDVIKAKEDLLETRGWWTHPPMRNALTAGVFTGAAFLLAHLGIVPKHVENLSYIIAILLGGYYWAKEGIEKLFKKKEIGIEILMIGATIGSVILGMWDEAAFLAFLYGAAEGLEDYTYIKTRHSIRKLLELTPKEARVIRNGNKITIPAKKLKPGDLFIVKPGESIPTDGIILKGRSSINEAPITGESLPVEKGEGMKVYAATINQVGMLEIEATVPFEDNTLSKMIHLVEKAQEQKGKSQLFIERFGRIYSPIVLISAFFLIFIPPLFGASISYWATRAVVLLVAAAPCALIMSIPIAIASGIGRAGLTGVLIKGGIHLENLGTVKIVAFDKTGTLTTGKPMVTDVIALAGDQSDILTWAYSLEQSSEHPLAQAIVRKAEKNGLTPLDATDFSSLVGAGVMANIEGRTVYVGNPELFDELGIINENTHLIHRLRDDGKTVVLVGTEKEIYGIIAIRDEPRHDAKEVITQLHRMGIKCIMLSGDDIITAKAIAQKLDMDEVQAELKPEDKIRAIEMFEKKYGAIAMVGDGINDAPALTRATVGLAMGTAGTDAAIYAADVALMADDLTKIPYAINIGKRAKRISRQNIVFSFLVLATLIPAAMTGIMTVALAVFLHEVSELMAVANGLRMTQELPS